MKLWQNEVLMCDMSSDLGLGSTLMGIHTLYQTISIHCDRLMMVSGFSESVFNIIVWCLPLCYKICGSHSTLQKSVKVKSCCCCENRRVWNKHRTVRLLQGFTHTSLTAGRSPCSASAAGSGWGGLRPPRGSFGRYRVNSTASSLLDATALFQSTVLKSSSWDRETLLVPELKTEPHQICLWRSTSDTCVI